MRALLGYRLSTEAAAVASQADATAVAALSPAPFCAAPAPEKGEKPRTEATRAGGAFFGVFGTGERLQRGHVATASAHSCGFTVQSPGGRLSGGAGWDALPQLQAQRLRSPGSTPRRIIQAA